MLWVEGAAGAVDGGGQRLKIFKINPCLGRKGTSGQELSTVRF